jgi:hypothetical protein
VAQFHIRAILHGGFLGVDADLVQTRYLVVRESQGLGHAGILSHAQQASTAAKSVHTTALPPHHPVAAAHALSAVSAELAGAASLKPLRATGAAGPATPLALPATHKSVLALAWIRRLWTALLRPTHNRRSEQYQKT